MSKKVWPLNINNFTLIDRLKIAKFILSTKNKWTQDIHVKKIEKEMATFTGSKYAVFVSSGSTANTILAQYYKDKLKNSEKNIIVFPSTTWQTSCSPWIREGFIPHFIDISLEDFSIDKEKLTKFVKENSEKIACIFPTSLIGFSPDMYFYKNLNKTYNVEVCFDNCENTLGKYNGKNLCSFFTSSTSTYFGHQIQSVEGGFLFTNSQEEYEYFLMQRNHGMTRSLKAYGINPEKYQNKNINELFDFYSLGNNFRNTDINAFIGQLDLKRADEYTKKRVDLYEFYKNNICLKKFYLPNERALSYDVPFCLPIICKNPNEINQVIEICKSLDIEYRPIISGFLGRQTCYKQYFIEEQSYPNSIYLHENSIYVGLYSKLRKSNILELCNKLNNI